MFNAEKENKNAKNFNNAEFDASDSIHHAKDRAREAGKDVYDFFRNNTEKLKQAEARASRTISSNPMLSAATIFATGWILGSLLKRSRKDNV